MPFSLKNYSSIKPLGTGGTSEIFRATQLSDSAIVVIKKIGAELSEQHTLIRQFEAQAESVRNLTHENIIRVLNHGCENGFYFMSMEYVDGIDLERFIAADFFTFDRGLMVVYQALKGLLYAHQNGVAHCDIKPGNILIARNGTVKLTDFGMADSQPVSQQNGRINMVFATPLYMSPEQAAVIRKQDLESEAWAETNSFSAGEMPNPSDSRRIEAFAWDLWSVGVLLYQICAKRLPFSGPTFADLTNAIITKKETSLAPPLYNGPASIGSLVHACLEKDPTKRLPTLEPLLAAFESYFSTLPEPDPAKALQHCFVPPLPKPPVQKLRVTAPPAVRVLNTPRSDPKPSVLKKRKPVVLAGCVVVLVLSVVVALLLLGKPEDRHAARPSRNSQPEVARAAIPPDQAPAPVPPRQVSAPPQPEVKAETTSAAAAMPLETAGQKSSPEKATERPRAETIPKPRQKRNGTLQLTIDPPRADVYIDGALLATSDLLRGKQLDAGNHMLFISLAGFEQYSQSLTIRAGSKQAMSISLVAVERGYGMLHIHSSPWSEIYIDRTPMGTAPTPTPLSLLEGPHFLELRRSGFVSHQGSFEIVKGQTTRLQVDLEKKPDSLGQGVGESN